MNGLWRWRKVQTHLMPYCDCIHGCKLVFTCMHAYLYVYRRPTERAWYTACSTLVIPFIFSAKPALQPWRHWYVDASICVCQWVMHANCDCCQTEFSPLKCCLLNGNQPSVLLTAAVMHLCIVHQHPSLSAMGCMHDRALSVSTYSTAVTAPNWRALECVADCSCASTLCVQPVQ